MKLIRIILILLLILSLILLYIFDGWTKLILGLITSLLIIILCSFEKRDKFSKFWADIGIAILGGLIVSFYRDLAMNSLNAPAIAFYIVASVVGIVLVILGQVGK